MTSGPAQLRTCMHAFRGPVALSFLPPLLGLSRVPTLTLRLKSNSILIAHLPSRWIKPITPHSTTRALSITKLTGAPWTSDYPCGEGGNFEVAAQFLSSCEPFTAGDAEPHSGGISGGCSSALRGGGRRRPAPSVSRSQWTSPVFLDTDSPSCLSWMARTLAVDSALLDLNCADSTGLRSRDAQVLAGVASTDRIQAFTAPERHLTRCIMDSDVRAACSNP